MIINIDEDTYLKCVVFAEQRLSSSEAEYKRRGESKSLKIKQDILTGAMGEWANYKYLADLGIDVCEPDMNIYEKKKKSFSPDLTGEYNFHIKSQTLKSRGRYGPSWLFQRYDKLVTEPSDKDYFIFNCINGREVEIMAIVKCKDITDNNLYGQCKVPSYGKTKVALYLNDLSDINTWRLAKELT